MKLFLFTALALSCCSTYKDNDEYLPPIDKPIEVQVREMFEFFDKPLINYDNKAKEGTNNQCPFLHDRGRNGG